MADLLAYDDLDLFGSECASPLDELEQDLWHRLIESYGSNPDDPDRGIGLEQRLSGSFNARALARAIELDFGKDPRVRSTKVTITQSAADTYRIDIAVDADAGQLGLAATKNTAGLARVP